MATQNGRCFYCRESTNSTDPKKYPTLDHMTPLSDNGIDALCNLVLSCRSCNKMKGSLPFEKFLEMIR